jgi:hypothetical protein
MPNTKNILIFLAIGAVFVSIYIFFIKKPSTENVGGLVSSGGVAATQSSAPQTTIESQKITQEFLSLLMNVKNIRLNSEIFADPAFDSLYDSSITLVPDGNEGRVNPFAQFGKDVVAPTCVLPKVLDTLTNTCVNPPAN